MIGTVFARNNHSDSQENLYDTLIGHLVFGTITATGEIFYGRDTMQAVAEINRLLTQIAEGRLDPYEPLFVIRARDSLACNVVDYWADQADILLVPPHMVKEARTLSHEMKNWPERQIPGIPDTRGPKVDFNYIGSLKKNFVPYP